MSADVNFKRVVSITFITIGFLNLFRIIGWQFFFQSQWWLKIVTDNWHHYQLGLALCLLAVLVFKKKPIIRDAILAVGSGMVIDESMYVFYPLNNSFSHYSWVGIVFELFIFSVFTLFVRRVKPERKL